MSPTLVATLALAAVLVFWIVGAYNRLVAMRNAIADAWGQVQESLQQRAATVEPLVQALRQPMAAELGALDTWLAAHAEATRAAAAMADKPVHEAHAQAWVSSEAALAAAASRVLALLDQHAELRLLEPVVTLAATWRDAQARLPFARQLFNTAASLYNDARDVFPTHLVARAFKLGRAGLI